MTIKTPLEQLEVEIKDIIWNVYREEDERAEGGSVQYRMKRVMKAIEEFNHTMSN